MKNHAKKSQVKFFSARFQWITFFVLIALSATLVQGFVVATISDKAPEGMVYCPLSKQFQPINASQQKIEKAVFEEICASSNTKQTLFRELFITNNRFKFSRLSLTKNQLENIAFDFLAHGKSVFDKLPNLPNLPSETLTKRNNISLVNSDNYELHAVWKPILKIITDDLKPRPPTVERIIFIPVFSIYQPPAIARRIAPRAPPLFS